MGYAPSPRKVFEDIRDILHGDNPDKLVEAFEYSLAGGVHVTEVIEATPTRFDCMAELIGEKYDGRLVRAEMAFDLSAGRVTNITLRPLG